MTRALWPVVLTGSAALLLACAAAPQAVVTSAPPVPPAPTTAAMTAAMTAAATPVPYQLLTHCGIDQAGIDGAWYQADAPQVGDAHSPPPGWGDPYQAGTVTVTGTTAVFRDDLGHEVSFHLRPGATGPTYLCD